MEGVVIDRAFWCGKTVFLTGHTGFKGSWLSLWLQSLGAKVIGYALDPPTQPSLFEIADVGRGMTDIRGDVRDPGHLIGALTEHQPEVVFHMAAQPLVRYSYCNPVETYETNVLGTVHLLEAVRRNDSVRVVVNVTTDKCYENREWVWGYREDEPMGGRDPYSSSKACSELITSAYRSSYFHPNGREGQRVALATARAGNVIGGGDWAKDRLIPDIMQAILQNEPVRVRHPGAIRPWQHVLDPLGGYLLLAERLRADGAAYAEAWNFGPEPSDTRPVRWVVEHITRQWPGAHWRLDEAIHPHEARYLTLDCSKAANLLGWHPRWNLETALTKITDWYRRYAAGPDDMRAYTLGQIAEYVGDGTASHAIARDGTAG